MTLSEIKIGDRCVHKSNPLLTGPVVGVDSSGPVRPAGPCVWLDHIGRHHGPWLRIGEAELADYEVFRQTLEPAGHVSSTDLDQAGVRK
jgi:hypothetical protein